MPPGCEAPNSQPFPFAFVKDLSGITALLARSEVNQGGLAGGEGKKGFPALARGTLLHGFISRLTPRDIKEAREAV
jgi:hypothetical protein